MVNSQILLEEMHTRRALSCRIECRRGKRVLDPEFGRNLKAHQSTTSNQNQEKALKLILSLVTICLMMQTFAFLASNFGAHATVLMRVCDTREIKTVTSRVCMLYKRTRNSGVKMDKQGNIRITRGAKGDYSPAKLATDCCKIGCPAHIFAYNC